MAELLLRIIARRLARELERHRLRVALVPAPTLLRPDLKLRRAVGENPAWYRELCALRTSVAHAGSGRRKHDTAIKRADVLDGLRAIAEGRIGKYHDLLRPLVERVATINTGVN